MITITLDGQDAVYSVLAALMDVRWTQKASNAAAESWTTDTLDWIAEGKGFTPRHGGAGLEGSISWHPQGGGARVYANKVYAQYIEEGTGVHAGHSPWVIKPTGGRKGLKIPVSGGGFAIRRAVTHPGSRPFPFFYADFEARKQRASEAAVSLLMAKLEAA